MEILIPAVVAVAAVLLAVLVWMGMPKGPSLRQVKHLAEPHLTEMEPQKVLLVEAEGDPNVVGKKAFGLLMKTYFRLKGVPKGGPSFKPPRARWQVDPQKPLEEWTGLYAMPVPDAITEVPAVGEGGDLSLELTTWAYGTVAQVLHVGPWDQEMDTIQSLKEFIQNQRFEISGPHEEEYLRGPGMLFMGNPKRYLTLIRYPVRKAEGGAGE
jgi:hypothetical protein